MLADYTRAAKRGFWGFFSVTTSCSQCPAKADLAVVRLKLLYSGAMWKIKHPAQEIWDVLSFGSTEQVPCFSFSLSHRRRTQRWAELFPSCQFKEERSHCVNYLWICCRRLVSFTYLKGLSSSTEFSPVSVLQGLNGCFGLQLQPL